MDYHKIDNVTIEEVRNAHMADISVQHKYGVKYHQFWVNEASGSVFCLVEGPDKVTCEKVHQMAHGNIACALTEVEPGFYNILMGKAPPLEEGLVKTKAGEVDLGYRNILLVSVRGITNARSSRDLSQLLIPKWARQLVVDHFDRYEGRKLIWPHDESQIAIFDEVHKAINCARDIQEALLQASDKLPKVIFKMGLSAAQPVTKEGDFFSEAIHLAHHLSNAANDNQILISSLVGKLCQNIDPIEDERIKCMEPEDERFLFELLKLTENKLSDQEFSIPELCKFIGISRPQLYRKITAITGRAPNYFLRDLRMEKALHLLRQKAGNVTQVSLEVGYNNPSYFTKCFNDKFGFKPSAIGHQ